jgi:hypothetical protein
MPYHWVGMERDIEEATVDGDIRTIHANRMKRDPRKRPPLLHMNLSHLPHNREDTSQEANTQYATSHAHHLSLNGTCTMASSSSKQRRPQQTSGPAKRNTNTPISHRATKRNTNRKYTPTWVSWPTPTYPATNIIATAFTAHHNQWQPKHQCTLFQHL